MKYIKALIYYLRSSNVATDPSLDALFKIIKELDRKSDKQNMERFNSYPIAKRLYQEDQHLLDYIKQIILKRARLVPILRNFGQNKV